MATILIAEDDELSARQMAHTLRTAGHDPLLAGGARTALWELALEISRRLCVDRLR